jgi:23S rRNA pseudouridine2605 synthase
MRINKYVAQATGLSRRAADIAIQDGRVLVNGQKQELGYEVGLDDLVTLDNRSIFTTNVKSITIMLNKPIGYVCSRDGQGSKTIYDLLPAEYHQLKPVGRLDKDSSGLILLTNYGQLAHELTHPSFQKQKTYEIQLNKPLTEADKLHIEQGIQLEDGPSKLILNGQRKTWMVTMSEGRNRQIRRTFAAIGYKVAKLHRTRFGPFTLGDLTEGDILTLS